MGTHLQAAITVEMEQVTDLQDIVRGNPIFVRLVVLLSRYVPRQPPAVAPATMQPALY